MKQEKQQARKMAEKRREAIGSGSNLTEERMEEHRREKEDYDKFGTAKSKEGLRFPGWTAFR